MTFLVDFEPIGRRGECQPGDSLLECARSSGVHLVNICGGNKSCGSCVIQIIEGTVSPIVDTEREHLDDIQLKKGYRLACCVIPESNCKVIVPLESLTTPQRTQTEGAEIRTHPDPVVKSHFLELTHPAIDDLRSDTDRLEEKLTADFNLESISFDFAALRVMSTFLRELDWRVNVITRDSEVLALLPEDARPLGLAIDLGTTKIAAYLMELGSGDTLASAGAMNPQIAYGEDVIARMVAAQNALDSSRIIQKITVEAINKLIEELCQKSIRHPSEIVEIVIVGNTAMHHLLLGLPTKQLGRAPYVPAVSSAIDIKARELGLNCSTGTYVHLLPNIAGFVGADHVAMLLASEIQDKQGIVLAIDIGTNTEICLANHGVYTSLSTASGPAFEGAHIKHGMRAAPGAIERFKIIAGKNEYQTINDSPPVGLCGSGILDVVAQLHKRGIIDHRGKIGDNARTRGEGKDREYVVVYMDEYGSNAAEVTLTQHDIEQIQLAKGAIRTGINVLLDLSNLSKNDLDQIIIAGAFGTYLDPDSAIEIGMLPDVPINRIQQVGNAAGTGAKIALVSGKKRSEAKVFAKKIKYIELAGHPAFMNLFAKAMYFGKSLEE